MRARVALIASFFALSLAAVATPTAAAACTAVPEAGFAVCDTSDDGVPDHIVFARNIVLPEGLGTITFGSAAGGAAGLAGAWTGAGGGFGASALGTSAGFGAATACAEHFQSGSCALDAGAAGRSLAMGAGHGASSGAGARTSGETPIGIVAADIAAACESLSENGCHRVAATSGAEAWGDGRRAYATYGPGPNPLLCVGTTGAPVFCVPLLG